MKKQRQDKILELIENYEIGTQEELAARLNEEGFNVTQATVSRDIRQLHLYKALEGDGKHCYVAMPVKWDGAEEMAVTERFLTTFRSGFVSMQQAQNILVIRTVSGMAGGVAAALDAMHFPELVGCIAGDDTIMCAIVGVRETKELMGKIQSIL